MMSHSRTAKKNNSPYQVGYFLPGDGWKGYSKIRRARNNMKSDWHPIKENPAEIVKVENYNQSFDNSNGDAPIEFTFNHSVQVTTAEDYTQTQRFEVSVNANIPVSLVFISYGRLEAFRTDSSFESLDKVVPWSGSVLLCRPKTSSTSPSQ